MYIINDPESITLTVVSSANDTDILCQLSGTYPNNETFPADISVFRHMKNLTQAAASPLKFASSSKLWKLISLHQIGVYLLLWLKQSQKRVTQLFVLTDMYSFYQNYDILHSGGDRPC